MKLAKHANSFQTNVTEAKTQNFGIGDASVVIEILRNRLYEHKIRTLCQEYMCNARDAMREVGNKNPIEVTVPTQFSPTFKVRDFGPGISPDRMQNVFVMYGASTKRTDNLQTGGFGIGAKSAWSYTDSFTIVTIVDGIKRTYVAHTGVNNNGRLDLISTENTTEANGTEIQVAVKPNDVREFQAAVFRASYFWDVRPTYKGTTQVPERVTGVKVTNTLEVFKYSPFDSNLELGHGNDTLLVIDGVPYELNDRLYDRVPELQKVKDLVTGKIVVYLKNGDVSVSASREKVDDSQQTIDSLKVLAADWFAALSKMINGKFAKAKTMPDFLKVYRELHEGFNVTQFAKFGNYKIDYASRLTSDLFKQVEITEIEVRGVRGRSIQQAGGPQKSAISLRHVKANNLELSDLDKVYVLDTNESKVKLNRRIREHLNTAGKSLFIITPLPNEDAAYKTVTSDLSAKGISSIQYTEPPKAIRVKVQRDQRQFCMHTFQGDRYEYTTLAGNKQKWLYFTVSDAGFEVAAQKVRELEYFFKDTGENIRICGLAPKAIGMVTGDANFSPLKDWIANYKPTAKHIASHKARKAKNGDLITNLSEVTKVEALEDWFITDMIAEYKQLSKPLRELPDFLAEVVDALKDVKDFIAKDAQLEKHMKTHYSLFENLSYYGKRQTTDVALYLNSKYKLLKKEGKVK